MSCDHDWHDITTVMDIEAQYACGDLVKAPWPADYVEIIDGRVYDVRYIGGGPHMWAVERIERLPATQTPWQRVGSWWRRQFRSP